MKYKQKGKAMYSLRSKRYLKIQVFTAAQLFAHARVWASLFVLFFYLLKISHSLATRKFDCRENPQDGFQRCSITGLSVVCSLSITISNRM